MTTSQPIIKPATLPVLLIEDEPQIRRFVRTALEAEGWSVVETETVKQGLTDAGTRKPDLVILDFAMPVMSGVEAGKQIRKLYPNVPIILFTLHAPILRRADLPWATRVLDKERVGQVVSIAEELVAA